MNFIWRHVKVFAGDIFLIFICTCFVAASILALPTFLAYMIDQAIIPRNEGLLWQYAGWMLLVSLISFLARSYKMYLASRLVNTMTMNIRNEAFSKIQNLSHHEFQEIGVPSLTTRITTDAFVLLQFTEMILKQGLMAPLMIIFSIIMITQTSLNLGLTTFPVAPLILLIVILITRLTKPLSEKQQTTLDAINRIMRESITGLRVIRAFNREEFQNERLEKVNQSYRQTTGRLFKLMAITPSTFSFLLNFAIICIIWFGADYVASGDLLVGNLVAFVEYVFMALFSLTIFANIFMMYPRASVSASRLEEIRLTPISVQEPEDPVTETEEFGSLEFIDVDFVYPDADEPVLRNISFKSKAGQTTAFIGSTGSGKSTIVKLIPRFYDVTKGQILVDGVDVRDYKLDSLRGKIGFTPQKALLFTGKIADNLRYGKADADEFEMAHATDISQAREFIERLETKFQTELAEGGTNLSGGQKQRLSIARSIIKDREIYIFDDSFSALDYKTDAKVRAALKEETQHATTIIVAQRVGTIMHADQIIVLDKGEIAAKGTHKELLASSPLYYEIASSQLSKEELEI
ncbi:ABC transporter ATP-binding protein [Ignavigranum ruoffiae]|uniref:ABC transporter ATP-binding protein n=1 Tax=Ignavigranum ruoffiae TaxID=89093 RepID=UPI0024ADB7A6|nr:ABC transporter ATP-binding protein [Ignavigranum ruoffiae]